MSKKRTGLMKKYIKLAGGDFKKAWKLQKAAERKKTGKKKVVKKKVTKKKVTRKKTVKKKSTKKRTTKRKVSKVAKKKRTYKRKRRRGRNPGNPGRGKMVDTLMQGAAAVAGAIGAGVVANMIPVPNPKMKAAIPIIAAIALASTKFGRTKMMTGVITGMAAAGGLSLVRQFAPNVPLLAGEDEMLLDYVSPEDEEAAMLGYNTDDLDESYGEDLDDEFDLEGEAVDLEGEDEFITSADI